MSEQKQASSPAYAKINLGLNILGKREDGYHEIQTIFQQIDLHDRIEIRIDAAATPEVALTVSPPIVPADESNLCYRAAKRYLEKACRACRVDLRLQKRIPIGAGLGGGSSDAAVVLMLLHYLLEKPLSTAVLRETALELGADVPFFLLGGTALATGIGERLTPLDIEFNKPILVVAPRLHISSQWAYGRLKNRLTNDKNYFNLSCFLQKNVRLDEHLPSMCNDFEPLIFDTFPELKKIKNQLYEAGAEYASLSGSGSALYGVFPTKEVALEGLKYFQPLFPAYLTNPLHWGLRELGENISQCS